VGIVDGYAGWLAECATFIAVVLAAITGMISGRRTGWRRGAIVASRVLLAGAASAVGLITLVSPYGGGARMLNLVPFASIRLESLNANHDTGWLNNAGNLVLFAPIGLLGILAFRAPWWRVVALAAAASAGIETIQYFIGRSADIDDLILNTVGAATGAAIALPIRRFVLRRDATTRRP
jgi:glycopeptide antibiotics resistance protein